MKKRILVTGANGFIGKNLVSFLKKDFDVTCLIRDKNYLESGVKIRVFDNYGDTVIDESVSKTDVVVHLASMIHGSEEKMNLANVEFTKILVHLSKIHKVKQFIYVSTENVVHNAKDTYTRTKIKAENEVKTFRNHTILRPTVVYGPGDRKYITRLMKIIKILPVVPILGSGKNKFQFTHVNDLGEIIKNSIKYNISGTYIVAGPDVITYDSLVKLLMKNLDVKKPVIKIPLAILRPIAHILNMIFPFPPITTSQLDNLRIDREYDIKKTVHVFKYKPTRFDEGIRRLVRSEFR